jgi:hypothetical protein
VTLTATNNEALTIKEGNTAAGRYSSKTDSFALEPIVGAACGRRD